MGSYRFIFKEQNSTIRLLSSEPIISPFLKIKPNNPSKNTFLGLNRRLSFENSQVRWLTWQFTAWCYRPIKFGRCMLSWQQAKLLRDPSHGWWKKRLATISPPKIPWRKNNKFHWLIWHDRIIYDLHNNHQTLSVNLSDTLLINHTNRKQYVCLWSKTTQFGYINWGFSSGKCDSQRFFTHEQIHHLKYMDSNYNRAHWAHELFLRNNTSMSNPEKGYKKWRRWSPGSWTGPTKKAIS